MAYFIIGLVLLIVSCLVIKFGKEYVEGSMLLKRIVLTVFFLGALLWLLGIVMIFQKVISIGK